MPDPGPPPRTVFVVSDGTGFTAENFVRACLLQYPGAAVQLQVLPHVGEAEQLDRILRRAAQARALVVTTLVRPELREQVRRLANEHRLPSVDLIGGLLGHLGAHLGLQPDNVPGRLHAAGDDYQRRIDAIEYAVAADDGRDLALVPRADVVLVGLRHTAKTPLALVLAGRGYRVANLPVRLEVPLPDVVYQCDQRRVFALTIDPERLQRARRARGARRRDDEKGELADPRFVQAELDHAEQILRRSPQWPVVDVTGRSVEEVSATIIKILSERGLGPAIGPDPSA